MLKYVGCGPMSSLDIRGGNAYMSAQRQKEGSRRPYGPRILSRKGRTAIVMINESKELEERSNQGLRDIFSSWVHLLPGLAVLGAYWAISGINPFLAGDGAPAIWALGAGWLVSGHLPARD